MDPIQARINHLEHTVAALRADLLTLRQVVALDDVSSALNKTRVLTERVLYELCREHDVSWGKAEPTLERMIGPLVSRGVLPKTIALHARTVQANASPGSHFQENALVGAHVHIALLGLLEILEWRYAQTDSNAPASPAHAWMSVRELARRHRPMPEPLVLSLALGALARLDARGIHHGEISARSLEIDRQSGIIALRLHDPTGSVVDLAPELLDGGAPTEAADVWGMGQLLYELLSGRPAFEGTDLGIAAMKRGLRRGLSVRGAVSEPLHNLVLQATAPRPADRPSLAMMRERLREAPTRPVDQEVPLPLNLDFQGSNIGGEPAGFFDSMIYVRSASPRLRFEAVEGSLFVENTDALSFVSVMQRFPTHARLIGSRISVEAHISGDLRDGVWAGLWLRLDDDKFREVYFDNMHDRPMAGNLCGQHALVSAEVPDGTSRVNFGVLLSGQGEVRVDGLRVTVESERGSRPYALWAEESTCESVRSLVP